MRVLVTGANRGLGLEVVRQYLERGEDVTAGRRAPGEAGALHELQDRHRHAPKRRAPAKRCRKPKPHPATKALKKAQKWQTLIDSGKVESKANIAREEGISRARVTQMPGLLKLAPEIREHILSMPSTNGHRPLSERSLRPLIGLPPSRQLAQFKRLQRVRRRSPPAVRGTASS